MDQVSSASDKQDNVMESDIEEEFLQQEEVEEAFDAEGIPPEEPVYSVALHPTDANIAASGGGDDKAYLWRVDTGAVLFNFAEHKDSVTSVAFNVDGRYVASGSMDGSIIVAETATGQTVTTLEAAEVVWLDWHPKGNVLLAGTSDSTIWMFLIPSGTCMQVFAGHTGPVTCGRFTHDGKNIVTGSEDGSLILWDPKTGQAIHKWTPADGRFHSEGITALEINKDDTVILTGSSDCTARLVHVNGHILGVLGSHPEPVEAVAISKTHNFCATGSIDGTVVVWDTIAMTQRHVLKHEGAVVQLLWKQSMLVACSVDGLVKVWEGRTGECLREFHGHQEPILCMAVGEKVITGSDDGCVLVFQ